MVEAEREELVHLGALVVIGLKELAPDVSEGLEWFVLEGREASLEDFELMPVPGASAVADALNELVWVEFASLLAVEVEAYTL